MRMKPLPHAGVPPAAHWDARWQAHWLLVAPHRLGFFLAMAVLAASAAWWALVQLQRAGVPVPLGYAVSPTIVHGAVMGFGFIPLFFAGFLFTAGPRWLGLEGPTARQVLPALAAQAGGWLLWLAGAQWSVWLALAGLALAITGLAAVTLRFWRLLRASPVPDRLHAKVIASALTLGCLALTGLALSVAFDAYAAADAFIVSGIWAFVVVVYVSVAHRMIPFFTASALPFVHAWRPGWVLALMLGMAGFEAAAVWLDLLVGGQLAWTLPRGLLELAAGGVLMWLAFAWGLIKSLKIRLLAMLHLGFLWLGIALALGGAAQLISAATGAPVLPLGALHALTMGCLGSLMLAMVTRVSCGHSGRALVADNFVWSLFWLLQAAVLLRIAGAAPLLPAQALLTLAALAWAVVAVSWGVRYGSWYGRPRADGRPG
jgi:uncharacterized protein involved in response to NO